MDELRLVLYWNDIPEGKENAVTYEQLCEMWNKEKRAVRSILHDLSLIDNGDDFVLIRSSKNKGFYKTDDIEEISLYRKECLNKGRSIFAPVKKCNRILGRNEQQFDVFNNLRITRLALNLSQKEVCDRMKAYDSCFDASMLSKMENGVVLPTPYQLQGLATIYGCLAEELIMCRYGSIYE